MLKMAKGTREAEGWWRRVLADGPNRLLGARGMDCRVAEVRIMFEFEGRWRGVGGGDFIWEGMA
jgi:hypothetical protein